MSANFARLKDQFRDREEWIRFLRFGVVGISGVGVNQGMLYLLFEFVHLPFYLSSFLAIETSIVTNFLLNDNWTWRKKRSGRVLIRLLRYNISAAFSSIFITMSALLFFKEWVGIPYLIANLLGIGFGMISNFLVNSAWTYGSIRLSLPRPVLAIMLGSLAGRLVVAALIGPGFDEAYYFAYSIRPSLSYFDHPPLVGFIAGFFPYLLDHASPFTIRLGSVVLFTVSGLFLYKFTRSMLSERDAVLAYALFNIVPLFFLLAGTMILPDSGLVLFWILALFPIRTILFQKASWLTWVMAGLLTGFAMISKYHGILLAFSLFAGLLLIRPRTFLTPGPYLFGLTALIPFLPVLIWNVQHDFISFSFQGSRAAGTTLSVKDFLIALGGQATYLTPMVFVPMVWIFWQSIRNGLIKKNQNDLFYFLFGTLPVLIFLLVSFFRPILPHWTLPGYILLTVPFAEMLRSAAERYRGVVYIYRISVMLIILLLVLGVGHIRWGILTPGHRIEQDVSLDLTGWDAIPSYLEENGLTEEDWFLFSHKWFLCGEIELATGGKYVVQCFSSDDPRGYGIWNREQDVTGRDGIFICSDRYFIDPNDSYSEYFRTISPKPDSVVISRAGIPVKKIYYFKCQGMIKEYPPAYH